MEAQYNHITLWIGFGMKEGYNNVPVKSHIGGLGKVEYTQIIPLHCRDILNKSRQREHVMFFASIIAFLAKRLKVTTCEKQFY